MHQRILRGTVEEVYDKVNQNPDYTFPALKGELTLVVAPYSDKFNVELYVEEENVDPIVAFQRKEASSRAHEIDASLNKKYDVYPQELISGLLDTLDVGHRDMCEIVSVILKISHNKAGDLVRFTKQRRQKKGVDQIFEEKVRAFENDAIKD